MSERSARRQNRTVTGALAFRRGRLVVGSKELPLRSAALHYFRVPRESWRDALVSIKALGISICETIVPWNIHEIENQKYDFGSYDDNKDLPAFLHLVDELDMHCLLRPGPHIGAELTYLGIPRRIIESPEMLARTAKDNPVVLFFPPRMFPVPSYSSDAYHDEVQAWYEALAQVVEPFLAPLGPVIMIQVDSEAGMFFRNGPFCQDYSPNARQEWYSFLEARFGNLEFAKERLKGDTSPPSAFGTGVYGEMLSSGEFRKQMTWMEFQEHSITTGLRRMRTSLSRAGLAKVPTFHNLSLGEAGLPVSLPALDRSFDLVGLDYFHSSSAYESTKRRTLWLKGSTDLAFAPELGVGAPPWFKAISPKESLFSAMVATAFGLQGFNLEMAVDRDRWTGALINARGIMREEAEGWKRFISALERSRFETLERHIGVGLIVPTEYARFMRATHLLGAVSPSSLQAMGAPPTLACRRDTLGFSRSIQTDWWDAIELVAKALTRAGVSYEYIDSDATQRLWRKPSVLFSPTFDFASKVRLERLVRASKKQDVLIGPALPTMDCELDNLETDLSELGVVDPFDSAALSEFIIEWVDNYDAIRSYPSRLPIETTIYRDGARDALLFVINSSPTPIDADVGLPTPISALDLMSGERFVGDKKMTLPMTPMSVRILELSEPTSASKKRPRARRKSP